MNKFILLIILVTTLAQATSHHERLGCQACIYEGFTWCSTYISPYARSQCSDVIVEEEVCTTKVAKELAHCCDKAYNPSAPPPADILPVNKTTVLNETTSCTIG